MRRTKHIKQRMQQRCISESMVQLILDEGISEEEHKIELRRQAIDQVSKSLNYELDAITLLIKDLQRLRRKGGATIVTREDKLITVYTQK